VILYGFYKFQPKHFKGKESFCEGTPGKIKLFTVMPLVCAKAPGKKTNPAIGSTGMEGRRRIAGFR
jgi:hypothetical protein